MRFIELVGITDNETGRGLLSFTLVTLALPFFAPSETTISGPYLVLRHVKAPHLKTRYPHQDNLRASMNQPEHPLNAEEPERNNLTITLMVRLFTDMGRYSSLV